MALVTLTEVKEHCRIREADTTQDSVLMGYMDAASAMIQNYLNNTNPPQNGAVKSACLMIIESLFNERGAYTDKELKKNPAIEALLFPYRENMGI